MKFRTEISIPSWPRPIDHRARIFSVGSCFADRISERLRRAKFHITSNLSGVLYNPSSIADALSGWFAEGLPELRAADVIIVTFGTAWVWELDGRVVANCERRPAHLFTRRRLSVAEIVERFSSLLSNELSSQQVVFTLSPVRHLGGDAGCGFTDNSLSKAVLRVAIGELAERFPGVTYFPAYEIVNDDLRDYRFYGPDLVHPSVEAVDYIWEKFSEAALSPSARALLPEIEAILRATEHRPFSPDGEEYIRFRETMSTRVRDLAAHHPELDLRAEIEFFG